MRGATISRRFLHAFFGLGFLSALIVLPAAAQGAHPQLHPLAKADLPYLQRGFRLLETRREDNAILEFDKCAHLELLDDANLLKVIGAYIAADEQPKVMTLANLVVERQKASKKPVPLAHRIDAYKCRAACYKSISKFEESARDYREAALIDSRGGFKSFDNAGENFYRAKKYDLAITCLKECLKIRPTNVFALLHLSQCYVALGKWKDALTQLNACIASCEERRKQEPDAFAYIIQLAYKERALCYEKLGQKALAARDKKQLDSMSSGWNESVFGSK